MKHLTLLFLLFSIVLSGQIVTYDKSNGNLNFVDGKLELDLGSIKFSKDTIKSKVGLIRGKEVMEVNIYEVVEVVDANLRFRNVYGNKKSVKHLEYLDENKKPLNKNYIIWQIKSEN